MTNSTMQDLKSLRIVYSALISGLFFFLIIVTFLVESEGPFAGGDKTFGLTLIAVSTLMALIDIPVGFFIFKNRMQGIEKLDLSLKIEKYRSAMIVRAAMMEGSGFFFVICFALVGSVISFLQLLAVLALMIYFFPTTGRLASELKHNYLELEPGKKA